MKVLYIICSAYIQFNFVCFAEIPIIIIGNKSDKTEDRQVPREKGQFLAINEGTQFMEVSAKNNECVYDCFSQLIKKVIMMQNSCSSKTERSQTIRLEATTSRIYSQLYSSDSLGLPPTRLSMISESGSHPPEVVHSSPLTYLCC